ncbi:S9 family peptidase [uncultured Maricaulis sp.]|uniref:alpha/beta hydrolase family protein n=1 Tax=uncultured Maricaulis sp. TaxID=174710 RepID=UPI0030DDA080
MRFLLIILALVSLQPAAIGQAPPSIEDFAALPNMALVRISPDGSHLAFISGESWEERNIVIVTLDGSEQPVVIDVGDDQVVNSMRFASNTHLWLTYMYRGTFWGMGEENYIWREYLLRISDQHVVELDYGTEFASINEQDADSVLTWVPADRNTPNSASSRRRGGEGYSLFQQGLDRKTARSREFLGTRDFEYILNAQDQPIIRQRGGGEGADPYELWTTQGTGEWHRVYSERQTLDREFHFAARNWQEWTAALPWVSGVDPTGRYAYFRSDADRDAANTLPGRRRALFRFDLVEERIEGPILSSDIADVGGLITDWRTNAVIGARVEEERPRQVYFDPQFQQLQSDIEAAFPQSNVNIVNWDRAFDKVVLHVEGGETSGAYYLINPGTGDVRLLARSRPRIADAQVSPVEIVHYDARDGLGLFGYLTLPVGRDAHDLPLVLMPHGGPESRDYYGFDEWSQLLASRGYAVFQPQFRGSGGYGVELAELGYGQWGHAMQNDLDDGVDALAARGIIDPDRVCIFGWSYGGYATLAGMTLTPDRYRCGIAGAGVSDIVAMMGYEQGRNRGSSQLYWARNIGDWRGAHEAAINAVSPAKHASDVSAPLMIIHGTEDIVVDYHQAEIMAEAMEAVGRPYELISIEGGRHYSNQMTVGDKLQLYTNLERFLLEHNPPDPAP